MQRIERQGRGQAMTQLDDRIVNRKNCAGDGELKRWVAGKHVTWSITGQNNCFLA